MKKADASRSVGADVPYLMKLADGRRLFVEVPARYATQDRSGRLAFTPDGVRFLDRVRALSKSGQAPWTPGGICALRQALGMTQQAFSQRVGVNKLTVSRWERGALRPSDASARAMEKLRQQAVSRGVVLSA